MSEKCYICCQSNELYKIPGESPSERRLCWECLKQVHLHPKVEVKHELIPTSVLDTPEGLLKEFIVVNKELIALNVMLDQSDTLSYSEESKIKIMEKLSGVLRIVEKLSDVLKKMEKTC